MRRVEAWLVRCGTAVERHPVSGTARHPGTDTHTGERGHASCREGCRKRQASEAAVGIARAARGEGG
eukprot:5904270-Prymnesium_polylepis.1